MHKFSRLMLVIGTIGVIFSTILVIYGNAYILFGHNNIGDEELIWEGNSPGFWDASQVNPNNYFFIYSTNHSNTNVTVIGEDGRNYFVECDDMDRLLGLCRASDFYGYDYLGELELSSDSQVTLEFSGNETIQIREVDWNEGVIPAFAAGIGVWGCCFAVFILLIGSLSVLMIGNQTPVAIIGHIPVQNTPMIQQTAVTPSQYSNKHILSNTQVVEYQNIQDPDSEQQNEANAYYTKLLEQGYDTKTSEEVTKKYFKDWIKP